MFELVGWQDALPHRLRRHYEHSLEAYFNRRFEAL
jgi:hypothetical protein